MVIPFKTEEVPDLGWKIKFQFGDTLVCSVVVISTMFMPNRQLEESGDQKNCLDQRHKVENHWRAFKASGTR